MKTSNTLPAALILAGGKARRWGGMDKGLIDWQGKTLVEHVANRLQHQVSAITISCNRNIDQYRQIAEKYNRSELTPCISDQAWPDRGPLAGIFEYLKRMNDHQTLSNTAIQKHLFICGCDTPLIPLDIVSQLTTKLNIASCDAVFPESSSSRYWLNLLVDCESAFSALNKLSQDAKNNRAYSVKNWLSYLSTASIPVNSDLAYSNINTPGDLQKLP